MNTPIKSTVNWSMICHLAGLSMYAGIPFGNVLIPLLIWAAKKKTDETVRAEGIEAINFNLSVLIYALLAGILCVVLIGYFLLPILIVAHIVLVIQAGLKANKGEAVHYPFTLRFIK